MMVQKSLIARALITVFVFFASSKVVSNPGLVLFSPLQSVQAQEVRTGTDNNYNEQLLETWENLASPEFIVSRKAVIDEIMDGVLNQDPEYSRRLLEADQDKRIRTTSTLVDESVYSSFQHQTKSHYLILNLKNGHLVPRRGNGPLYFQEGIYLELHRFANPQPFSWGDVELHFDFSLLNRKDYYINTSWAYGDYMPDSASPAVNLGRTHFLIEKILPNLAQNEVVFTKKIPLSTLKKIVVPRGFKSDLIQKLESEKVACPVLAMSWDELIAEHAMPEDAKYSTKF